MLWRLFDDFVAWKAEKYSCSSCLACSDMLFELEWLALDDSDVRDDDGVSDRCVSIVPCRVGFLGERGSSDCGSLVALAWDGIDVGSGNL